MSHHHPGRADVVKRLARISGHVQSIRKMLEDDRGCADLIQQMNAVIKAMEGARHALLTDHMEHCVAGAVAEGRGDEAVDELKRTLKIAFR
ncbi:MAG: metal-sensitive transcriptional regulator [Deltaproteobacteria bacterium]|nr:metal-sensitive transcriptional regulator [Deltaproteobacteria bacterium]